MGRVCGADGRVRFSLTLLLLLLMLTCCRFKGAYTSVWEREPCPEIFGEMDVMAETPLEMADKIIAASS